MFFCRYFLCHVPENYLYFQVHIFLLINLKAISMEKYLTKLSTAHTYSRIDIFCLPSTLFHFKMKKITIH